MYMSRHILAEDKIHPNVVGRVANLNKRFVDESQQQVDSNEIVILGMMGNPHCYAAQSHMKKLGKEYLYLEYGSYLTQWRKRNALKMWTGWPTFPMVFVKGQFVGGASDLKKLIKSGELK